MQQNAEPLTAIFAAAAGRTLEDIERHRADLAQQIETLEQQRVQSQDDIFKTRAELDRMDGSSAAADAEQALAGLAAHWSSELAAKEILALASKHSDTEISDAVTRRGGTR